MAKKYYAVKKGVTPGIYTTWADCQKNINGFSGAIYKSFLTVEEADAFLSGLQEVSDSSNSAQTGKSTSDAVAYVDGSYNIVTKEYSYGAVIFYDGKEEHFSKKFSNPEMAAMRNVAGEIEGSMCAMQYCVDHNIKSIDIYYDYEGIANWCIGAWKANKEGTQNYKKFYDGIKDKVKVNFVKVKGHSGDKYNDLADALAKAAVGIE
ncbi:MAG: ribonuclease H family protein [Clostridiales bacterium]|nr:ribonuclease H family protein [Clostridiales bacterium]